MDIALILLMFVVILLVLRGLSKSDMTHCCTSNS